MFPNKIRKLPIHPIPLVGRLRPHNERIITTLKDQGFMFVIQPLDNGIMDPILVEITNRGTEANIEFVAKEFGPHVCRFIRRHHGRLQIQEGSRLC
jgi:hypothetical protein